jgi:predicted RNase H-like HicB family nuclease
MSATIATRCLAVFEKEADGGYSASIAQLRGVHSQGDSLEEALANITDALEGVIETYHELDQPIPWEPPAQAPAGAITKWVTVNG